MDVLAAGLAQQTMRDFEVILVDYWWEERRGVVERSTLHHFAPLIHVPPRLGRWRPMADAHQAWNTGLALARGKVVCSLSDYWLIHPRYIEEHFTVWEKSKGTAALSGEHTVHAMPRLGATSNPEHPPPHVFAALLWSTLDEMFCVEGMNALPVKWRGVKPLAPPRPDGFHPVPWSYYWAACNESAPLDALYKVNGYDEAFDGGRTYGDVDLAARLEKVGVEPVRLLNGGLNQRLDPHELPVWATHGAAARDLAKAPIDERANAERAWSSKNGGHPFRAVNGGFDISAPITVAEVIASYECHRPENVDKP